MPNSSNGGRKKFTHTAFAFRREGKRMQFGRWLEIGVALKEPDGKMRVFLDRLPIGGFSGGILLSPITEEPPQEPPDSEGEDYED
jgi:hypothetical protein